MPSLIWPDTSIALRKLDCWARTNGFVWPEPCYRAELRGAIHRDGAWSQGNAAAGTITPKERRAR